MQPTTTGHDMNACVFHRIEEWQIDHEWKDNEATNNLAINRMHFLDDPYIRSFNSLYRWNVSHTQLLCIRWYEVDDCFHDENSQAGIFIRESQSFAHVSGSYWTALHFVLVSTRNEQQKRKMKITNTIKWLKLKFTEQKALLSLKTANRY